MGHVDYMAAVGGLPTSHVFDLERPDTLDPRRRAALAFARKLTRSPAQVSKADVDALRAELSEKEVVQLVFAICHFNTMNRLADAFGVPLEPTNVFAQRKRPAPAAGEVKPGSAKPDGADPRPSRP